MPRTGVSYDKVSACIQVLEQAGLRPSIRNIRDRIGRGSLTTIAEHKRTYDADREDGPAETLPDPIAQGLMKGAEAYWHELVEAAQAEIDRAEEKAAELIASAQQATTDIKEQCDALQDELGSARATQSELETAVRALTGERDALEAQRQEHALSIAKLTEALKAAETLAEERSTQITALHAALDRERAEHAQLAEQLNERIDAQALDHARELAANQEQLGDLNQRLSAASNDAEMQREAAQQLKTELAKRDDAAVRLQSDTDRLNADVSALRKDNRALTTANGKLQEKADTVSVTLRELKDNQATLIAEKDARIADLLDTVATLKAAAKRRAPNKKPAN